MCHTRPTVSVALLGFVMSGVLAACDGMHARALLPVPGRHISSTAHSLQLADSTAYARVWAERSVPRSVVMSVASEVTRLRGDIGRDFGVDPGRLRIELFATHRSFARALWRERRQRPQTPLDNTSAIVHGTLLCGPLPAAYRRHNLAHVYTEWVIDRLTGNTLDALPPNPWLYDGLAEYEAYRYVPAGLHCTSGSSPPFDITSIRTARAWMALRPGPLGDLEYCLAYLSVRTLVNSVGWGCVVHVLHQQDIWAHVLPEVVAAADGHHVSVAACRSQG